MIFILIIITLLLIVSLTVTLSGNTFVHKKFWKEMEKIAKKENIEVIMHDSVLLLNKRVYPKEWEQWAKHSPGQLAAGVYSWSRVDISYKKIHLYKKDVWTFAHELGHHFSIKLINDDSEEAANGFRRTLALAHMPLWHRMLIPIEMLVYCKK